MRENNFYHVRTENSTFGDRSFAAAGPRTWNELRSAYATLGYEF